MDGIFEKGIVLFELLLFLTLFILITPPLYWAFASSLNNQDLAASANEAVEVFRSAHVYAQGSKDATEWGVRNSSQTMYELISRPNEGSPISIYDTYILRSSAFFVNDFTIWFNKGTGSYQGVEPTPSVVIQNKNGKQMEILVYFNGVFEIRAR